MSTNAYEMTFSQIIAEAVALYEHGRPLHMLGAPGIGKTHTARAIRDTLAAHYGEDFGFVEMHPATMDSPDWAGIIVPSKTADGRAASLQTIPPPIAMIEATGKARGILFIDEFGQCEQPMQKAIAPALDRTTRRIGAYTIPAGWYVVLASNRTKDKSGANRILAHVANRCTTVEVGSDPAGWIDWATANNVHPHVITFAERNPSEVFRDAVPSEDGAYCTPRSLTDAAEYLAAAADPITGHLPSDTTRQMIAAGMIGRGASAVLFAFLAMIDQLPSPREMIENPEGARVPDAHRIDAHFAAMRTAVYYSNDAASADALFRYVSRLTPELVPAAAMALLKKAENKARAGILSSPAVARYIAENRDMLSAVWQRAPGR